MFPCFVVFFYLKITRGDRWVFPPTEGETEACKGERIFPKTVVEGKTPSSDSGLCDSSRRPPHEAQGRFWAEGSEARRHGQRRGQVTLAAHSFWHTWLRAASGPPGTHSPLSAEDGEAGTWRGKEIPRLFSSMAHLSCPRCFGQSR